MDKGEARSVALARVEELRRMSWKELRERFLERPETTDVLGESGVTYQVQTNVFWDGAQEGDLRVIVAVDDGGWRAFAPLSEDFIVAPDGSFADE